MHAFTPVEAEIRRVCDILESIAKGYAPDSAENRAIGGAALADQAVQRHQVIR